MSNLIQAVTSSTINISHSPADKTAKFCGKVVKEGPSKAGKGLLKLTLATVAVAGGLFAAYKAKQYYAANFNRGNQFIDIKSDSRPLQFASTVANEFFAVISKGVFGSAR